MNLAICSLASGSSGNCYLVFSQQAAVLVDAGISARQTFSRTGTLGFGPDRIQAHLITHEHSDHIKGLAQLVKKTGAGIYASAGTIECFDEDLRSRSASLMPGDLLVIEDLEVECFRVSHDAADPVAYSFRSGGSKVCIITDTGYLSDDLLSRMEDADILVLESNHDENILRMGRYPWFLKKRILGEEGHLSNEAAAKGILHVLNAEKKAGISRRHTVLLAHLSKENNFPEMALTTVRNCLEQEGYYLGDRIRVEILPRDEQSPVYWV